MIRLHAHACKWAPICLVAGCANPLDYFGVEERVIETELRAQEDETLGDNRPEFDAGRTALENFDGCDFLLNKSQAITRLSLQALRNEDDELDGVLFPTRAAALDRLGDRTVIPSMEVVNAALKPFLDGVYAAVELISERGTKGALVNKRGVLDALLAELVSRHESDPTNESINNAIADFSAAQRVGGAGDSVPSDLESTTMDRIVAFTRDGFRSKPIDYYTWLPALQAIYQRDRLLMYSIPQLSTVASVLDVFAARPDLQSGYASVLRTFAGLTNPSSAYSPVDVVTFDSGAEAGASGEQKIEAFLSAHGDYGTMCGKDLRWIPPLTSIEERLFDRLACGGASGSGNILETVVRAIQSGSIDLTPNQQSGFHDRQLYALETLLLPERGNESAHLLLTKAYRDKLVETFQSVITRTTETSAKQLFLLSPELFQIKPVNLYPRLPIEPFPTYYLRTARAYAFLENFLRAVLGTEALESTPRVLENGRPAAEPIAAELRAKIRMLYGLHILAAGSIGMGPELSQDEQSSISTDDAEAEARHWLDSWKTDPDVLTDSRTIVPVSRDDQGATYSVVAGVKVVHMYATYPKDAEPQIVQFLCPAKGFVPFEPYMLVDQTLQVTRHPNSAPLTRDELRAIANKNRTVEGLRQALEATL